MREEKNKKKRGEIKGSKGQACEKKRLKGWVVKAMFEAITSRSIR